LEETYQIHDDAVLRAQAACDKVADRWKDRLHSKGFHNAAMWIDLVVENGRETLFYNQSPVRQRRPSSKANNNIRQEESIIPGTLTTLGCLWSVQCPQPENTMEEPDPATVIEQLDAWGHAGHTDWPHDWSLVKKLVQDIPQRLYYKLKKNDEDSVLSDDERQKEKDRALLRKRKKRKGDDRPKRPTVHKPPTLPTEVVARLPYDAPPLLTIPNSWPPREQAELDAYFHHPDDASPSILLLGALQDVGRYHCHEQRKVANLECKTWKQQRTWQRDRVRQRLAGHKPLGYREMAGHRPSKSRVLHCHQGEEYFVNLDISHCLVEWKTAAENHLLFFANVEVVLKDEAPDEGESSSSSIEV
jgi:hypothetical protein